MEELLRENASAIFTLVGTIAGAVLSYFGIRSQQKREVQGRLWKKVLDRRIDAHEEVIQLVKQLRTMISFDEIDEDGELKSSPAVLSSREAFEQWYHQFLDVFSRRSTWLSTDLTRELNLLQDYSINLHNYLCRLDSTAFPRAGNILRGDFIKFSDQIEKLAFTFFSSDLSSFA